MTEKRKTDSPPADPLQKTKDKAMALLALRPLSEAELRKKLTEKGFEADNIEQVIALCLDYGCVDDEQYAAMLARQYRAKGYGPRRLRAELTRRGVAREIIDRTALPADEDDDTLDRLVAARLRGRDCGDPKQLKKTADALLRRGWSWTEVREAIARYEPDAEIGESE